MCKSKRCRKRILGVKEAARKKKKYIYISWHIIEGHFGAKLLIDKSTNLPGRR